MVKLILKNRTNTQLIIAGVEVPHNSDIEVLPTQWMKVASDLNLDSYLTAGTLIVNDGYDDFKKEMGFKYVKEGLINRPASLNRAATVIDTANTTIVLTYDTKSLIIFTGTIAGQIIKLPDARTINRGFSVEIWNTSTNTVAIQCNAGNGLFTMLTAQKTSFTLQADDNQCGTWLVEANFLGGTGGGNGTISFGFDGTASTGRWLESLTNVASNISTYAIAGSKAIRALSISTNGNSTTTITIYKNGVALNTISTSASSVNTKLNLNHILNNTDKISASVTSGSSARPVVVVWL